MAVLPVMAFLQLPQCYKISPTESKLRLAEDGTADPAAPARAAFFKAGPAEELLPGRTPSG
jgi:hypothetical protein